MKTATAVEASAVKTSAEARLAPGREASGYATMIKTAEGPRADAALSVWRRAMKSSSMKTTAIESSSPSKVLAISKNSAVRDVAMVVEKDAVMPIPSPMAPAPAEPAKKANSKTETKSNPGSGKV